MCYGIPWYSINEKFGVCYLYTQSNQLEFMYSWHFLKITSTLEWHTQDNMYMYTILYRKSIYRNNYTHGSRPKAVAPINIEHSIKIPIVLRVSLGVSLSLFLTLFSSLSLSLSTSRTLPTLNSIQAPIPMHPMCIILYNKPSYKIFGYRFLRLLFFIYYHLTFSSIVILKRCHCWQLLLLLFGLANVVYVRNVPVLKFSIRRVSLPKHIQSTHTHPHTHSQLSLFGC